ncbi:MAG: hypothetical protein O4806_05000 [Trichodesmium sp. St5_bin8]|nr:hypothetical protein [Trichodesmium sp. St5_bin8]
MLQKDDELYLYVNELHYFYNKQWENNAINEDVYQIFLSSPSAIVSNFIRPDLR